MTKQIGQRCLRCFLPAPLELWFAPWALQLSGDLWPWPVRQHWQSRQHRQVRIQVPGKRGRHWQACGGGPCVLVVRFPCRPLCRKTPTGARWCLLLELSPEYRVQSPYLARLARRLCFAGPQMLIDVWLAPEFVGTRISTTFNRKSGASGRNNSARCPILRRVLCDGPGRGCNLRGQPRA